MRYRHLRYTDRVRDVDIDEGVSRLCGVVFRWRGPWRKPEVGPWLWYMC
jgi:hypothetical protein